MHDLATAAVTLPVDPAAVTTWPGVAASLIGLGYVIYQQVRNSRATRRVEHELTNNGGGTAKDGIDRIEEKVDAIVAAEPGRRARARAEAGALALLGAAVSIAVTLTRTR